MTREAASPQTMVMTLLKGKCTMLAPQKTSGDKSRHKYLSPAVEVTAANTQRALAQYVF